MVYPIESIEGIGPTFRAKLRPVGIQTTEDFLRKCCDSKGRSETSQSTGVSESLLLTWANRADLMRISGIGPQYSELLEATGVDTVKELRTRNAENLTAAMLVTNNEKMLSRLPPQVSTVRKWIEEAKTLEPLIRH